MNGFMAPGGNSKITLTGNISAWATGGGTGGRNDDEYAWVNMSCSSSFSCKFQQYSKMKINSSSNCSISFVDHLLTIAYSKSASARGGSASSSVSTAVPTASYSVTLE